MNTNTNGHTCSYYCERPECVRRQRDELRDRMESTLATQQQGQAVYQIENDPEEWFDVDRAMYEGHDGSRKRILYSAAPPPAIGEEIMVNAAHDVYILPLQPSGLSSGPRFVVHVPAPEQQPAGVDEAAREDAERWRALRELDGGEIYALLGDCDGIHPEQADAAIDRARGEGGSND